MGKTLIIAEKPSVGRDIAKAVLTNPQYREGYIESEKAIVTWAVGHLAELKMPHEINPTWKKWQLEELPILPKNLNLKICTRTQSQFNIVKKLIQNPSVARLINACDAGREGERIFRNIVEMVGVQKPTERLWISSMTTDAIRAGFRKLMPASDFDSLGESARCRDEADWLTGMNLSRVFTLIQNCGEVFSVGRVQTPTLAMIVKRDQEIENFKPEPYWQIKATFGDSYFGYRIIPKTENTHIKKEEEALEILKKVKGKLGKVEKIETSKKSQSPYLLHDLTELQREANRRYHYSAAKTLEIAQKLYEHRKVITYPRTDSRFLTQDIVKTIPSVLQRLGQVTAYQSLVQGVAQNTPPKRFVSNAKVKDHHAIIPTTGTLNVSLTPEEKNIFDLIARRFLSILYPVHQYLVTKVWTSCEEEQFLTNGKMISQLGWKVCYPTPSKSNEEGETPLPILKKGEERPVTKAEKLDKKTQPPKRYTEGTLLSAMETAGKSIEDEKLREAMKNSGLGTPATRAGILENLKKKNYIELVKKSIYATEKAKALIKILPEEIISPALTATWESRLRKIENDQEKPAKFLKDIQQLMRDLVDIGKKTTKETFKPSIPPTFPGKKGNSPLLSVTKGKTIKAGNSEEENEAAKFIESKMIANSLFGDEEFEKLKSLKKNRIEKKKEKEKEKKKASEKPKVRKEVGGCPKCGTGKVREYPKSFSCERFGEGCRFTIWKQYAGRTIKLPEARSLLKNKETKLLKNFKSRNGKPFSAYLFIDSNLEVKMGFESSAVPF